MPHPARAAGVDPRPRPRASPAPVLAGAVVLVVLAGGVAHCEADACCESLGWGQSSFYSSKYGLGPTGCVPTGIAGSVFSLAARAAANFPAPAHQLTRALMLSCI